MKVRRSSLASHSSKKTHNYKVIVCSSASSLIQCSRLNSWLWKWQGCISALRSTSIQLDCYSHITLMVLAIWAADYLDCKKRLRDICPCALRTRTLQEPFSGHVQLLQLQKWTWWKTSPMSSEKEFSSVKCSKTILEHDEINARIGCKNSRKKMFSVFVIKLW